MTIITMHPLLASIVCAILFYTPGLAQTEMQFSVGRSVVSESILPAGSYDVWLVTGGISRQITKQERKTTVHMIATGEYGHTIHHTSEGRTYDLALNLGFDFRWRIAGRLGLYFKFATGPAYLSTALPRQAGGFLFSNNFILGFRYALKSERVIFSPGIQFRHLSNAKHTAPNSGIDNVLVRIGVQLPLSRS
jgi:hypothetical protein